VSHVAGLTQQVKVADTRDSTGASICRIVLWAQIGNDLYGGGVWFRRIVIG